MTDIPNRLQIKIATASEFAASDYEGQPGIDSNYYVWRYYAGGTARYSCPGDLSGSARAAAVYVQGTLRIGSAGAGYFTSLTDTGLTTGVFPRVLAGGLLSDGALSEDADNVYSAKPFFIETQQVKRKVFGCIYLSGEGSTAQSIPSGATYTKITPFTANMAGNLVATPNYTTGQITVNRTGLFMVGFSRTYTVETANVVWHVAVFVNGVIQPQTILANKSLSTNTPSYADLGIPVAANSGDTIDIRLKHDNGSDVAITYEHATLSVTSID